MKRLIIIVSLMFLASVTCSFAAPASQDDGDTQSYTAIVPSMAAISEWVANFTDSYHENGIYQAVAEVFEEGISPDEAFPQIINVEGVNPQNLVAAAYCAGAKHEDIRVASENVGISEEMVAAGFRTAMTVCGEEIADTQAYTPSPIFFTSLPDGGNNGRSYGSPSSPNQLIVTP